MFWRLAAAVPARTAVEDAAGTDRPVTTATEAWA
jgi:hypothetical protein